jgi:hypothetical protein
MAHRSLPRKVTYFEPALDQQRAGFFVKSRALPDNVIVVTEARSSVDEQGVKPVLAFDQRPRAEIFAVKMEKIETGRTSAMPPCRGRKRAARC